jgi:uncharacterized protein
MSDVINNRPHHRFELEVDGHVATEHYRLEGNVITFEQTEVPPELGGKGVGSKLVQGALDQVRAEGLKVVAGARSSNPGSASIRSIRAC